MKQQLPTALCVVGSKQIQLTLQTLLHFYNLANVLLMNEERIHFIGELGCAECVVTATAN